jgi:hypothetical protein
MNSPYPFSSDLHSVVLPEGAVILGKDSESRTRSMTERYILERLRSGESLSSVARSLISQDQVDIENAQRAVDEFANGLLERRRSGDPEMMREWIGV